MFKKHYGVMSLMISLVLSISIFAGMGPGQKMGIDLGPTVTDNWNNITGNGIIAGGSVTSLDGSILSGISITVAEGRFFNNDGADNWVGLTANGGSAPEEFVDSVTTDIAGTYGAGMPPFVITVAGLSNGLTYDVVAVCTSIPPYANEETLTINDTVSLSLTRDDARDNGTFHNFTAVATDGNGNLTLTFTNDPQNNPIVCGILITAVAMGQASSPQPETEADDVLRNETLSWIPGMYAVTHDVYWGTSFDDVNAASTDSALNVLVSAGQHTTTFDPGRLEFNQTYYWRVDEVNGTPDKTVFKGDVWNFTVEPIAIPIETVTATASAANADMGPENTVNGSGLNDMDQHSVQPLDMWLAQGTNPWIQYEFDKAYKLHELLIWNSNQVIEAFIGFGVKELTVETSTDGTTWTRLEDVTQIAQAPGSADYAANTAVALGGITAKYVKLTMVSAHGFTGQFGLSEVRFLAIPTLAREPQPASGAILDNATTTLSWRAGREAVEHQVLLGTNAEDLPLLGTAADNRMDSGALDYSTTYYWSITEVNQAETPAAHAGPVWHFTTPDYAVVDDFESYSGNEGEEVFMTWFDGFGGDGSLGGSTTGHIDGPSVETTLVASGGQSMPIFYDNDGGFANIDGQVSSPSFSEVVREFDPPQDWTASGIQSLSLAFRGTADNSGQLYVKINGTKVVYNGAATDIASSVWLSWVVDLSTVAGNLTSIRELSIGIDGGGAGMLYIDDIRLHPKAAEIINPIQPDNNDPDLVAYYALDGNTNDNTGNYPGGAEGDVTYVQGVLGQAAYFNGIDALINAGDVPIGNTGQISVSCWVQSHRVENDWLGLVSKWTLDNSARTFWLGQHANDGWLRFSIYPNGPTAEMALDSGQAILTEGEWIHVVCTYDGDTQAIYAGGVQVAVSPSRNAPPMEDRGGNLRLGIVAASNWFDGFIDEVRIYNRAVSAEEALGLAGKTTPVVRPF